MDKQTFLDTLRRRLSDLPASEVEKSLAFYEESIDDRVEDGMDEYEAVAALGSIDEIERSIREAQPLTAIVAQRIRHERAKRQSTSAFWIVLAIVGSPVWLPLLISVVTVVLSLYVTVWAVVISFGVTALALVLAGLAALVYGILNFSAGIGALLFAVGAAGVCIGLGLLFWALTAALGKGAVKLAAAFGRWLKRLAVGKGGKTE